MSLPVPQRQELPHRQFSVRIRGSRTRTNRDSVRSSLSEYVRVLDVFGQVQERQLPRNLSITAKSIAVH